MLFEEQEKEVELALLSTLRTSACIPQFRPPWRLGLTSNVETCNCCAPITPFDRRHRAASAQNRFLVCWPLYSSNHHSDTLPNRFKGGWAYYFSATLGMRVMKGDSEEASAPLLENCAADLEVNRL